MSVHRLMSAGRGPRECEWALAQLVPRMEADAEAHGLTTDRWRAHDALVRGNPVRTERPQRLPGTTSPDS